MNPRRSLSCRIAIAAVLCALPFATGRAAPDNALVIHVPSRVRDEVKQTVASANGPDKSIGHGLKFGIYPAVEVASEVKLTRPLDGAAIDGIYALLQEQLTARGYAGAGPKERPDVMITVQYGRTYLANPYLDDQNRNTKDIRSSASLSSAGLGTFTRIEPLRESKLQAASEEKLFITIVAWEFDSMPKGRKPLPLWSTTIKVDDPDHRDLGQLYPQMLLAGAEYFNRRMEKEEVDIPTELPAGRVELGAPRVVDGSPPGK